MDSYSHFAKEYSHDKDNTPYRVFMERWTIQQLLPDVTGQTILDLACGCGNYSRMMIEQGARKVVGIDCSKPMLEYGSSQTPSHMNIVYQQELAESYRGESLFDQVFHAYLLNCADSYDTLTAMCHSIAQNLKPGGNMLGIISFMGKTPAADYRQYNLKTQVKKPLADGEGYKIWFYSQGKSNWAINYNWSQSSYEKALSAAGLISICWHDPKISPQATASVPSSYWDTISKFPVFLAVTAQAS